MRYNLDGTPRVSQNNLDGSEKYYQNNLDGKISPLGVYRELDGDTAEIINSVSGEHCFRQNGYQLKFESANSDYLDIDYLTNWANLSDANFKVTFEIFGQSTDTRTVYCDGGFKNAVTGLIRFIINPNSYGLFCYVTGVNNANLV
jgi:hypothetical protein